MLIQKTTALLLLGLAVRECFSFWTGHPSDFELWVRMGYAMIHGGNPYGVLSSVPGLSYANVFSFNNAPTIAYLPFWPIVTAAMFALYSAIGVQNRFVYYFLLKQPVIMGDIAVAYLLYSYVSVRKSAAAGLWAMAFWLFSPFTLIISSVWGMFDSIAISFMIISLMSTRRLARSIWTGLAIFVKSIPIIYAAPTALKRPASARDAMYLLVAVGLPVLLSAAIFFILKWPMSTVGGTLGSTVGKGGESMSIWDALPYLNYLGLSVPAPEMYDALGYAWIPAVFVFTITAFRRFGTESDHGLIQTLLVCTFAFLIFKAQITEQYALYFFSLAVIDVGLWHPERKWMLLGGVGVAMVYLVVNNFFLLRFLSPVYPGFVNFESALQSQIGPERNAVDFLAGTAFTLLNVKYLMAVLRRGSVGPDELNRFVGEVHQGKP